jgi:hypothetical protein
MVIIFLVALGVVLGLLFVRLLPLLLAIVGAVWFWHWLFHDPTWLVAIILTMGILWTTGIFGRR